MLLELRKRSQQSFDQKLQATSGEEKTSRADMGAFPTIAEFRTITDACAALSIVYFGQILTEGDGVPDFEGPQHAIARNSYGFGKKWIKQAVQERTGDRRRAVQAEGLCEKVQGARNRMIAHADGPSFDLQKFAWGTKSRMISMAWDDLDFDHFLYVVVEFEQWILDKMSGRSVRT